jgi:hypothetical protein
MLMRTCVDLRTGADRFRPWNELDERKARATDDVWDLILPGRGGFVAPWGGSRLVACTRSSATTQKLLAIVPGARVHQDGSDGQNVVFDAEHLDAVAKLLRLRRRRVLADRQRRANRERLKPFAFPKSRNPGHSDAASQTKSAKTGSKPARPYRRRTER